MIKKFFKKDPIEDILIKMFPQLVGGAFFYAKIGGGKTAVMLSVGHKYKDNYDYNMIDIYGGERNENLYPLIPSDEINYWDYAKKKFNIKENQEGPKQYKYIVWTPFLKTKIKKRIPHNPSNVINKIVTIPINKIEIEDIKSGTSTVSDTANALWRECLEQLKNSDAGPELQEMIRKKKGENQLIYKNLLKPLIEEQFLQSKTCVYNFDILNDMKNREAIKVLNLDHVPPAYHLFIITWIFRQVKELLHAGKIKKKNIFLFREAREIFNVKDDSVTEDRVKWFRKLLINYIRYGRRGMHIFVDTQSPSETRGICEGSQDLTFLGRISATSREDRAALADALYAVGKITKKQIEQLGDLSPGEFFLIANNEDAQRKYILLPRTLYWKGKYKNFDSVWTQYVDKWIKTEEDKKILNDDFRNRENMIKEKKEFEKKIKILTPVTQKIKPTQDLQVDENIEVEQIQKPQPTEEIEANI